MDSLDRQQRSERMRLVRSQGNRSTEARMRAMLVRAGIRGWRLHGKDVPGCPDFVFDQCRLVVFVDGCFWHGCPICKRPLPSNRRTYWRHKIEYNQERAAAVGAALQSLGYSVIRIWEHQLRMPQRRLVIPRIFRAIVR